MDLIPNLKKSCSAFCNMSTNVAIFSFRVQIYILLPWKQKKVQKFPKFFKNIKTKIISVLSNCWTKKNQLRSKNVTFGIAIVNVIHRKTS